MTRHATQQRRSWARAAVWLIVLNEARGAVVVGMTWPAWWPIVAAAWRHALSR